MTEHPNLDWHNLQSEITLWALHNFGVQGAWQPMLGLVEEVGEYVAAREALVGVQARALMEDAIADQCIYALNLCQICNVNFFQVTLENVRGAGHDAKVIGALAAASHAVLKHEQGIRGITKELRREKVGAALALWFSWVVQQSELYSLRPALALTSEVWEEVRKRDWRKRPEDANKVVASEEQGNGGSGTAVVFGNKHDLVKTGDVDVFPAIQDRNGEVVLSYCRRCRKGEGELGLVCPGLISVHPPRETPL